MSHEKKLLFPLEKKMKGESEETESETTAVDWSELTHDCLINILSRLTLEDRWRGTMLVSKSWFRAFKDPSLHSVFNLDPYFKSSPDLNRCLNSNFERRIDSMLQSVVHWSDGFLTEIRVTHCSDRSIALVAERCPNLEVLSIRSCPHVTDASISRIALMCPKLRELDISYCGNISHESLTLFGGNCPNLKVLKRNLSNRFHASPHTDGESDAAAIATSMPHLEWLEIRFSELSAKGLNLICEGCPNLEFLDLSGCAYLSDKSITNASSNLAHLKNIKKPNFFRHQRYDHQMYDPMLYHPQVIDHMYGNGMSAMYRPC